MNPTIRRTEVLAQEVGPDLLVYDQRRDATHSLNATAAFVYRHADGSRSVEEIAALAAAALGLPDDTAIIEAALSQIERARLLEPVHGGPRPRREGVTRREVVRRLGVAALAVPVVTSILAPTPLMAQSVCAGRSSCSYSGSGSPYPDPDRPSSWGSGSGGSHDSEGSHGSGRKSPSKALKDWWKRWK